MISPVFYTGTVSLSKRLDQTHLLIVAWHKGVATVSSTPKKTLRIYNFAQTLDLQN